MSPIFVVCWNENVFSMSLNLL